jgi:hypothetical protein
VVVPARSLGDDGGGGGGGRHGEPSLAAGKGRELRRGLIASWLPPV